MLHRRTEISAIGYGSRGMAVVGFKFDTMRDMEDPVQFAKRIGVRYPLAVAADDLKQKFGGISRKKPELLDGVVLQQ